MTKEVPRTSVLRDEELIAYLRLQGLDKDIAAADRIELLATTNEQLVATNEALSIANATLIAERDQWIAHAKNAIWSDSEQLRLAEAELAALVEALENVIGEYDLFRKEEYDRGLAPLDDEIHEARATLARVKGETK